MNPLNHDERMAIINRPFVIVTHGRSGRWGGVTLRNGFDLWDPQGNEAGGAQEDEIAEGFQIETVADAA